MTFFSKEKLDSLKAELEEKKGPGRKILAERLDEAKSFGDLKENAEYHQAREDQGKMEARILELEDLMKEAEVLEGGHKDCVVLGASVEVSRGGVISKFDIVEREESDILSGKLDIDSPLARAMFGKKEGDGFDFVNPKGDVIRCKVIKIV